MKPLLLLLLCCSTCGAADRLTHERVVIIVRAIYKAEGGAKARHPYGVKSVKVASIEGARAVCERSVINNYARWHKAGRPAEGFVRFMSRRYCPPDQENWARNVELFCKIGK